jgi:hypothetical protein
MSRYQKLLSVQRREFDETIHLCLYEDVEKYLDRVSLKGYLWAKENLLWRKSYEEEVCGSERIRFRRRVVEARHFRIWSVRELFRTLLLCREVRSAQAEGFVAFRRRRRFLELPSPFCYFTVVL